MPTSKRFHSAQFIPRLSEFLTQTIESEMEKAGIYNLSTSHFEILSYLIRKSKPCSMTEISLAIHRRKPTVTVLVSKLEEKGFVERKVTAEDKRGFSISLTKQGKLLRPLVFRIGSKVFSLNLWGLDESESKMVFKLLEKIYLHIHREDGNKGRRPTRADAKPS